MVFALASPLGSSSPTSCLSMVFRPAPEAPRATSGTPQLNAPWGSGERLLPRLVTIVKLVLKAQDRRVFGLNWGRSERVGSFNRFDLIWLPIEFRGAENWPEQPASCRDFNIGYVLTNSCAESVACIAPARLCATCRSRRVNRGYFRPLGKKASHAPLNLGARGYT
jgi:hypothetical protein